jgi:hypothetical protein
MKKHTTLQQPRSADVGADPATTPRPPDIPRAFYNDVVPPLPPSGDPRRRDWYEPLPPGATAGALPPWQRRLIRTIIIVYCVFWLCMLGTMFALR